MHNGDTGTHSIYKPFQVAITKYAYIRWFIERSPETKGPGSKSLMNCFCGRTNTCTTAKVTVYDTHKSQWQAAGRQTWLCLVLFDYQSTGDEHDSLSYVCVTLLVKASSQPHPDNTICVEAVKLIRKKITCTLSFFLLSLCYTSQWLLKQPIMLPRQEAATDLPAALFLFGFVNRVFHGPHHQIWNRNCSLISLEAGWRRMGEQTTSLHHSIMQPVFQWAHHKFYPTTAPFPSTSMLSSPCPPWYKYVEIYEHNMLCAHTHLYVKENQKMKTE